MKTIHKVKIDLLTPGLHPRVYAVQDDICTREVQISLYSGSVSWTPTSGAGVAVGYRKSDGTVGIYDTLPDGSSAVSISGNVVTVILAAQMLTAAGTVEAAVTLAEKSGNQITTFAFDVIVSANPGSGAIKSEDYFNYVNPKIQAVIEQAAAATTAANTAASRANASAELAEDAYDLADTANQKVDTLREVVSKLHSNIVETASGEVITVSDSAEAPLQGLKVFGKTTQNGIPTPDAPVALESVGDGGSVTTTVCGKNCLKNTAVSNPNMNGVKFTVNDDGSITATGTANSNAFLEISYVPYADIKGKIMNGCNNGSRETFYLYVGYYDASGKWLSEQYILDGDTVLNSIKDPAFATIRAYIVAGFTASNLTFYPMIRMATETNATYKPPKATTATVSPVDTSGNALYLPGIPVTSGGNYKDANEQEWICDEVDFEKGVYVQRVAANVLDGTENWLYNSAILNGTGQNFYCVPSEKWNDHDSTISNDTRILSTAFTGGSYRTAINAIAIDKNYLNISVSAEKFPNVSALKEALAASPVGFQYILAKENHIPLSEIDPDALAQYAALHTNYPNTTVFNDAGACMELKYVADTKKYVDNKFAELAAALVSST